jgi:hypothetical protein
LTSSGKVGPMGAPRRSMVGSLNLRGWPRAEWRVWAMEMSKLTFIPHRAVAALDPLRPRGIRQRSRIRRV